MEREGEGEREPTLLVVGNVSLGTRCGFRGCFMSWLNAGVNSKQFWKRATLAKT